MSLELRGVHAGYGGTEVLHGVDLIVPAGAVVALLGANGAGKTTLLRTAAGLLRPERGEILLDEADVTDASPSRRAKQGVCLVPEGRAIFPSLTVTENLRLMSTRKQRDAVELAVEAFPPLRAKLAQVAGTMSGGEQQMLALTRAYLTEPRFVLLDEVSMGLAPLITDAIFDFLRGLAQRGTALLIVEQYVARALELADAAYILHKGAVVFSGTPAELDTDSLANSYLGASL